MLDLHKSDELRARIAIQKIREQSVFIREAVDDGENRVRLDRSIDRSIAVCLAPSRRQPVLEQSLLRRRNR